MDDEELDESLRAAARLYHVPPDPPREAMWRAIEAERRGQRGRPAAPRRWVTWAMAAAAILALGLGLGRLSAPGVRPESAPTAVGTAPAPRVNETAYRLATQEHLGQSEAFLTLFRSTVGSGTHDRLASATARQLLATNRLLLDSPAGGDRKTRLLLEDLELVLAEIAQLSAEGAVGDRELIRDGMQRGGVLDRLRTAVPAGTTPTRGEL